MFYHEHESDQCKKPTPLKKRPNQVITEIEIAPDYIYTKAIRLLSVSLE